MSRERVKPVRTNDTSFIGGERETHPAYASIQASRVSGAANLAGSDFNHQHYIVVRISEASSWRSHSNDRWFAGDQYIEVAMSEAQWATFISTLNHGSGTPATLTYLRGVQVPGIEPLNDKTERFKAEVSKYLGEALKGLNELHGMVSTKKLKELVRSVHMKLISAIPFVEDQFREETERSIERARVEIEATVSRMAAAAGLTGREKEVLNLGNNDEHEQ